MWNVYFHLDIFIAGSGLKDFMLSTPTSSLLPMGFFSCLWVDCFLVYGPETTSNPNQQCKNKDHYSGEDGRGKPFVFV